MFLLAPALVGWAAADLPKKAPLAKYSGLWVNSPFTSKPPPPTQGPEANPLEDYALAGVSPISSGYRVTLLNKKKPDERITVDSDKPSGGFKILAVTRKPGEPLGTVVRMSSGSVTGSVAFDEKLLTLTPPPAANPAPQAAPPGVQPQPPQQPGQPPQRQPRPRVVPPPAPPNAQQQMQPPGQPQAQPMPIPGQPIQNAQRPGRRR
jgi:hypothetical protein